jgi:hypothetical protein
MFCVNCTEFTTTGVQENKTVERVGFAEEKKG